jgi:hypothetical protein
MMRYVAFVGIALSVVSLAGCGAKAPRERLVGKWIGTPSVTEAVDEVVDSAVQGTKVNPLARGAARFLGNMVAKKTMSVELDLRDSGTAFFRGNTAAIDMPEDSDGTWEVVSANPDIMQVRFKSGDRQIDGKVVFRDAKEFTLKLEPAAETSLGKADAQPADSVADDAAKNPSPPQRATAIVFKPVRD